MACSPRFRLLGSHTRLNRQRWTLQKIMEYHDDSFVIEQIPRLRLVCLAAVWESSHWSSAASGIFDLYRCLHAFSQSHRLVLLIFWNVKVRPVSGFFQVSLVEITVSGTVTVSPPLQTSISGLGTCWLYMCIFNCT